MSSFRPFKFRQKRRDVACTHCRRRKCKCESIPSDGRCRRCIDHALECQFKRIQASPPGSPTSATTPTSPRPGSSRPAGRIRTQRRPRDVEETVDHPPIMLTAPPPNYPPPGHGTGEADHQPGQGSNTIPIAPPPQYPVDLFHDPRPVEQFVYLNPLGDQQSGYFQLPLPSTENPVYPLTFWVNPSAACPDCGCHPTLPPFECLCPCHVHSA